MTAGHHLHLARGDQAVSITPRITQVESAWMLPRPHETFPSARGLRGQGIGQTVIELLPRGSRRDLMGLCLGPFNGSIDCGEWSDFELDLTGAADTEGTVPNGILSNGMVVLRRVWVRQPRGDRQSQVESFGVRLTNHDPHGICHGGNLIEDVMVTNDYPDSYVSGIVVGTRLHPGIPLLTSVVRRAEVHLGGGNQAGFTAGRRVRILESACSGVAYAYWCDTASMDGVEIDGLVADVDRAAVGLAVVPGASNDPLGESKTGLVVRHGHFRYHGPGPHYAFEAFDDADTGGIQGIHFEDCVFDAPGRIIVFSSSGSVHRNITFNRCVFPPGSVWHGPKLSSPSVVQVDGRALHLALSRYAL